MPIKKPHSSLSNILPEEILNPDFARIFAQAKSARRADRLNPTGFNLVRRGNPKQISNPEGIGLPIPYKEGSNAKFGLKLYTTAGIPISA